MYEFGQEDQREAQANARLICAAPEMLAALKAALDWHRGDKWRDSEQPQRRTAWAQQLERLEAAIRKAEEGK